MMDKRDLGVFVVLGFLLMGFAACLLRAAGQANAQQKGLEDYLKSAKAVAVQKGAASGRGAPWIVSLNDGKSALRGIFKYVDQPRPSIIVMCYKYELAAYELAKLLGLDIVPPVVEREIDKRKGSLQLFLESCLSESDRRAKKIAPPDPKAFENALEELSVFENLTYCKRSLKDILIHKDTWRVCRVDFAEAFETIPELLPEAAIARCSRRLYRSLLDIRPLDVESKLKPYLNAQEIKALLGRMIIIIEKLRNSIKDKGEPAVIFDLETK